MDRPLLKSGLIMAFTVHMASFCPLYATMVVDNPTLNAQMVKSLSDSASMLTNAREVLATTGKVLGQVQRASRQLDSLNSVMGSPIRGEKYARFMRVNALARDFGGVTHHLSSSYGDPLSSVNRFSRKHLGTEDKSRYIRIQKYVRRKLFNEKPGARKNPLAAPESRSISFKRHDEIKTARFETLKTASINGLTLSGQQKDSLGRSNEELQKLDRQVKTDRTIQDEIRTTNQILILMVNELSQQRALLAQLLELKAAVVANQMPLVFNKTSLAKRGEGARVSFRGAGK